MRPVHCITLPLVLICIEKESRYLQHLTSSFMENPLTDISLIGSSTFVCYHKLLQASITLAIWNNEEKRGFNTTKGAWIWFYSDSLMISRLGQIKILSRYNPSNYVLTW